jgi:aspartate/tyrosine/aromatic aminotransferase
MEPLCYSCKKKIRIGSLKTSRTRLVPMGITPPEGMSAIDKICTECLHEFYEKQIKKTRIKELKNRLAKDLLKHRNGDFQVLPRKIGMETKKKFLQ